MKILVSGATGLVGSEITSFLKNLKHEVSSLSRDDFSHEYTNLSNKINGFHAIIHLSGEPILQRWTPAVRKRLVDSRVESTKLLAKAINEANNPPSVLLVASAVGIYSCNEINQEDQFQTAPDFLGHLVQQWEEAASLASPKCRVINMRFGVILSDRGGALKQMLPIFKMGLGGKIGTGKQPFPWIHISDVTRAIYFLINTPTIKGPLNFVAPQVIDNLTLTKVLSSTLKKPALFVVPRFIIKLLYGEAADTLLKGQIVKPKILLENGFSFNFSTIDKAISDITKKA